MSKIMILGDLHLRATRPVGRCDDIIATEFTKLQYAVDTAYAQDVLAIIQPGDFFDTAAPPYSVVVRICRLLKTWRSNNREWFCVAGQHDMMMRSANLDRTALGLLKGLGLVQILDGSPTLGPGSSILGASYGAGYAAVEQGLEQCSPETFRRKILVTHDSIGTEPLFPGHQLTPARRFLTVWSQFDLIVCGDYHYPFKLANSDTGSTRYIVNAGCLLRLTRSKRDMAHEPLFYIYDTRKRTIDGFKIFCEPASSVFAGSTAQNESAGIDEETLQFIEQLKRADKVGIDFMHNLEAYLEEKGASAELKQLLSEVLHAEIK